MVCSPFLNLPSDKREANNEDGRYGVLVFSPHAVLTLLGLFGNLSDRTFETRIVRKMPMLKIKKMFGNDPFKNNFRETDLGWLAD